MYYRIRFINADGRVAVLDLAFSQVVATLKDLDAEARDAFWNKADVLLADGRRAKFVREV
jgi:hypothetical protein